MHLTRKQGIPWYFIYVFTDQGWCSQPFLPGLHSSYCVKMKMPNTCHPPRKVWLFMYLNPCFCVCSSVSMPVPICQNILSGGGRIEAPKAPMGVGVGRGCPPPYWGGGHPLGIFTNSQPLCKTIGVDPPRFQGSGPSQKLYCGRKNMKKNY